MKKLLLNVFALFAIVNVWGQTNWCGTDSYNESLLNAMSPEEAANVINFRNKLFEKAATQKNSKSGAVITIPVVVHVMYDDCEDNISAEQVFDGLRIINEDYRRKNSDSTQTRTVFGPYATDTEIQFEMAQIDPSGNCTDGIVRVKTPLTNNANNSVKGLSVWPPTKYLNIWLVKNIGSGGGGGTILGYAQFPFSGASNTFGLVVRSDIWGTIGTSRADGRTGTHEIGHCLGLYHTFQSGCGNSCSNSGDRICDTPPASTATWSCNTSINTCSNDANGPSPYTTNVPDQIENFMSYNSCQNMFSQGQTNAMHYNISKISFLKGLVSSSNLVATGTNPGFAPPVCKPKSDYCQDGYLICESSTITFTDYSYRGPIASRTWSFPGGTPASSSDSIVTVTYPAAGVYNVSLTTSNSGGSHTKTKNNVVTVEPMQADLTNWRYDENFENKDAFDTLWNVINLSQGRKWELTDKAAYTGNNSVYILNHINGTELIDELVSPAFDMSAVLSPRLSFKAAYARKSESSNDVLIIYYSYDCGKRWSLIGIRSGVLLQSVSDFRSSEFIPVDQSEWREFTFNLSTILDSKQNVRIKFEFESGGGSNIYIDDISIESVTGIEEQEKLESVYVYPNPVSNTLFVDFSASDVRVNQIVVRDISGRIMNSIVGTELSVSNGQSLKINVSDYAPGIYFIRITDLGGQSVVRKFVVR